MNECCENRSGYQFSRLLQLTLQTQWLAYAVWSTEIVKLVGKIRKKYLWFVVIINGKYLATLINYCYINFGWETRNQQFLAINDF